MNNNSENNNSEEIKEANTSDKKTILPFLVGILLFQLSLIFTLWVDINMLWALPISFGLIYLVYRK